jgi:YcaO-like protein with predicted kinase domain
MSPAETLERVSAFFPALGITRVADITGLDELGIPVVAVCRPNSRSVSVAYGKGLDRPAATASGVMESTEAFMAERIDRPLVLGSFSDLRASHALADVESLPRTTDSLYHPELPILWIEGRELFSDTPRWVPYEMVHTAYTLPMPTGTGCFIATSNGLASGNHILEAISHGICEVVERDAITLHDVRPADGTASRRVDPRTVDDAACRDVLGRFDDAGISVGIWDMTTNIGIPAFLCLIARASTWSRAEGMGCHPDRAIALLRALTEAAQMRLVNDAASESRPEPPPLAPDLSGAPVRDFTAVPTSGGDSLADDVDWELAMLRSAGIREVIALDLTRAEFQIPVARIIVPGLEGPTRTVPTCRLGPRAMEEIGRP